jgi:hypothetical protein
MQKREFHTRVHRLLGRLASPVVQSPHPGSELLLPANCVGHPLYARAALPILRASPGPRLPDVRALFLAASRNLFRFDRPLPHADRANALVLTP